MAEWRRINTRKIYTIELKREAVRPSYQPEASVVLVAEELGITDQLLYKWRKRAREQGELAFPGNGKVALSEGTCACGISLNGSDRSVTS